MKQFFRAVILGFLVSCSADSGPLDPVWSKEPCTTCKMLVSDPRWSAQLLSKDGERKYFDDIGCMAEYLREAGDHREPLWVRGADSLWVDARAARYSTGARTPMDYGYYPAPDGTVRFDEILGAVANRHGEARP